MKHPHVLRTLHSNLSKIYWTVMSLIAPHQEYYDKGDYVIREGEEGNTFFIIAKGKVRCNKPYL